MRSIQELDVTSMLANDLMPCEDVDTESVGACLEAIHEWCSQLHTLSDHIEAVKESIEFDRKQEYELNGFQSCIKGLMSLSAIK